MASNIAAGGTCQKIAISTTSAQSVSIPGVVVHVTPTTDCFVRDGSNPTALSDGTDHFLVANATQEFRVTPGDKLAFVTSASSGSVYVAVVG